jgi:hypothetical protein
MGGKLLLRESRSRALLAQDLAKSACRRGCRFRCKVGLQALQDLLLLREDLCVCSALFWGPVGR